MFLKRMTLVDESISVPFEHARNMHACEYSMDFLVLGCIESCVCNKSNAYVFFYL